MVRREAHELRLGNLWEFPYHPAPLYSNTVRLDTLVYLLLAMHLPVSQPVGHDDSSGVLRERRNNVRTTRHIESRYML